MIESNAMPKEDSSDSFKFAQKVEFDISLQVWHLLNNPVSQNTQSFPFFLCSYFLFWKKKKKIHN